LSYLTILFPIFMGLHNFLILIKNRNFGPKWKILIRDFWSRMCFNRKVEFLFKKKLKFLSTKRNFWPEIKIFVNKLKFGTKLKILISDFWSKICFKKSPIFWLIFYSRKNRNFCQKIQILVKINKTTVLIYHSRNYPTNPLPIIAILWREFFITERFFR